MIFKSIALAGLILWASVPALAQQRNSQAPAGGCVTIGTTSVCPSGAAATISGLTLVAPALGVASATSLQIGSAALNTLITISSSNSSTTLSATANPAITIMNLDTTNNNFEGLIFRQVNTSAAVADAGAIFAVNVNHTAGTVRGDLVLMASNGGLVERARAFAAGDFRIGTGSALATTATDGFLLISTTAGVPTGVPTNAGAGQIPAIFDKTNNKMCAYNGGWKCSAAYTP